MNGEPEQGRLVSREECAAIGDLPLPMDWGRVRLYREGCGRRAGLARRLVLWLSRGRACALGNHVFLPARCEEDVALMAHEMTHCAQYQAWGPWRYFTRGAAAQIRDFAHRRFGLGRSPYAYRPTADLPFDAYGMEQQAQIVEDAHRGNPLARAISGKRRARAT
ncbi:MAG TPA: DUF4157 domain-containing protein [Gemmatimonadales bacterium]|nr:DUF4157 domain-containing protein [Gemmatimonadales bacterium]